MWLYLHHTANAVIDLDPTTLKWRKVDDSEKPKNARVLADLPIRGSYTVEGPRHYFAFWTDDQTFVFASDDGFKLPICRTRPDGSTEMLIDDPQVRIDPVPQGEPGHKPGQALVRIEDGEGQLLFSLRYGQDFYRRLFNSDLTAAASERTMDDWDFFVALQGGVDIFKEEAASNARPMALNDAKQANIDGELREFDDLLIADSGDPSPRAGVWACTNDLNATATVREGEPLPQNLGRHARWVWSRPR